MLLADEPTASLDGHAGCEVVDRSQALARQNGTTILSIPLRDHSGRVFAVTQLLNRNDGQPFTSADEEKFAHFADSLGVILETLHRLHGDAIQTRRRA